MSKASPQTSGLRVTPAGRRALELLACAATHVVAIGPYRRGNVPRPTARWLIVNGLAHHYGENRVALTSNGAELCREEGLL